jgi:hypothetical protein
LLSNKISKFLCNNISRLLYSKNSRLLNSNITKFVCSNIFKIVVHWKNISLHNRLLWSGSTILRLLCSNVSKLLCSDFWEYCAVTVPSVATPRDRMGGPGPLH